jgi:hypothetical protein
MPATYKVYYCKRYPPYDKDKYEYFDADSPAQAWDKAEDEVVKYGYTVTHIEGYHRSYASPNEEGAVNTRNGWVRFEEIPHLNF